MSSLNAFAGSIGRLLRAGRSVARYGLRLDTNPVPAGWSHVTKVDPEERKKLPLAFPRYLAHTDAVSVGGSADVTDENTASTFALLEPLSTPAFHEPSGADHVTRETLSAAAFLAIPQVLNGDDEAFVGTFGTGVEAVRDRMAPEILGGLSAVPLLGDRLRTTLTDLTLANAVVEAYVVQNPDSAAARESGVTAADVLDPATARRRAMAAEYVLDAEVLYLEYSGTYGGDEATAALAAIDDGVDWTRVWYGGGVDSRERSTAVLDAGADAVVVGDAFHRIAEEEARLTAAYLDAIGDGAIGNDVTGNGPIGDDVAEAATESADGSGFDPGPDRSSSPDTDADPGSDTNTDSDPYPDADPETDSDPNADPAAWLARNCVLAETAAARYLSTIPDVEDPVAEARRCLAAGLRARRAIADEPGGTASDGRPRASAGTVATVEEAVCVGVDDPTSFATRLVAATVHGDEAAFPPEKLAGVDDDR